MSYLGLRNGLSSLCVCEVSVHDWWSQGGFLCVLHNDKRPQTCEGHFFVSFSFFSGRSASTTRMRHLTNNEKMRRLE